eukprot:jgi/Mesen1/9204/ME000591S08525
METGEGTEEREADTEAHPCLYEKNIVSSILSHLSSSSDRDAAARTMRVWNEVLCSNPQRLLCRLADRLPKLLDRFSHIRSLSLSCCTNSLSDKDLRLVGQLSLLQELTLQSADQGEHQQLTDEGLALLAGCKSLRILDLRGTFHGDGSGLAAIVGTCGALTSISLQGTGRHDTDWGGASGAWAELASARCPQLTSVRLVCCTQLTEEGLAGVFACASLTSLHLEGTFAFRQGSMHALHCACAGLRHLHLAIDSQLARRGVGTHHDVILEAACAQCRQLASVSLKSVPESGLSALARCSALSALEIGRNEPGVERELIAAIAANPGLRRFSAKWYGVSAHTLVALASGGEGRRRPGGGAAARGQPCLEELEVQSDRVGDAAMDCLATCHSLRALSLQCRKVTDGGFTAVATGCRHLALLSLAWQDNVGDRALQALAGGLPELRTLNLHQCNGVTSLGIAALGLCSRLEDLSLMHTRVDDAALLTVLARCRRLRRLNLSQCGGLTDLRGIATCRRLETLELSACPAVCDAGLDKIAAGCSELRELNIDSTRVTDVSLQSLSQASRLRSLTLTKCRDVSGAAIARLARSLGWLREIAIDASEASVVPTLTALGIRVGGMVVPPADRVDLFSF